MDFIKNNLVAILILAACAAGLVMYQNYFAPPPSSGVLASQTATSSPLGGDLLSAILELKTVNLDPGIFSDPVFVSLVDYGTVIPTQPIGRPNPFAPLSGAGISGTSITSTSITSAVASGTAPVKPGKIRKTR